MRQRRCSAEQVASTCRSGAVDTSAPTPLGAEVVYEVNAAKTCLPPLTHKLSHSIYYLGYVMPRVSPSERGLHGVLQFEIICCAVGFAE